MRSNVGPVARHKLSIVPCRLGQPIETNFPFVTRSEADDEVPVKIGPSNQISQGEEFEVFVHFSVCTSTDNTAGRSRTIGAQLSPASVDAYTCPPVVPK